MPDLSDKVSELAPCPFCGSVPVIATQSVHQGWYEISRRIVCRNKDCFGPATGWYGDDEAMFAAWNRRTRPPASSMEGWQTVPEAATDEMMQAGEDAFVIQFAYIPPNPWSIVRDIYRAMLAASPIPPEVMK